MRLFCVLLLSVAVAAAAGQNPDVRIYLDFDPPNGVHRVDDPASPVAVYVVLDCFGAGGGFRGCTLYLERTFGASMYQQVSLLGGLDLGDVEDPGIGWVFVAGADCVYPDENGMIVAGYVLYWYTGPPGHVRIVPTEFEGRYAGDCDANIDLYCIHMNAGIGVDPPPGDPVCDCPGSVPVEDVTWGTIKSLYR